MRPALLVFVALSLIGILLWWFGPSRIQPEQMAPAHVLAFMIIERFPDSLDFIPETRLGEWLDLEATEFQNQTFKEWFLALTQYLDRACLVLHTVEHKESGAFRPHLTAFLHPASSRTEAAEDWIRQKVREKFGEGVTTIVEEDSAQVMRGSKEGQVLFMAAERGWLLVSNSEAGWKDVRLTLDGRAPNLGAKSSFREIQSQVSGDLDLFFYFNGEGLAPLVEEFGYGVRIDGKEVFDAYWVPEP